MQYAFVYRELTASRFNEDSTRLETCLRLLEFQRDTWKQVCEKMESSKPVSKFVPPLLHRGSSMSEAGFSLEA